MKKYSIIYADPPWAYRTYSKKGQGRSAESHYPTMCIEDIKALPVGELAAKDCALFLWITFPCLCEALEVLTAWGFSYKTVAFVWVKQNRKNDDLFTGMGYWTRANAEICIASQRAICEDYIARHDDLELVCEPFVDDGYSGVSFNRPQFKKLEEAIRKGALDCIVVKDLSRFSRNYIDGGRYIEKIFPQLGIRFIAINDAYDSLTGDPQSDSFVIPFKNLINDSYCKDISMKIRSSLEVKQKSGEFVGSFAPYGYMKSPENKNQLIVDEAVSEYVQMIFSMYKDGFSIGRIAKRLNQMGVLSPMEYKHSVGVKFDTVFKTGDTAKWTYKAVQRILTNEVYIGVLAQGKRGTPNYKVRVVKSKDESEWVKVENAHEALVSYEDFMAVKVMMQRDMKRTRMIKTSG